MRKKKKSNKFLMRRMVAMIAIILIILAIRNISYYLTQKAQMKQVRLLLDNEIVSLINQVYVEDSVLYVSQEDIKQMFDNTIDYNIEEKELITTYNKHIAVLNLNENYMLLNDVSFPMQGQLKEMDSKIYLPISDLDTVYDIEVNYAEKTNLVIIDSIAKAKKQVIALNNAKIKTSKFPFATTMEKISRGENLYSIEKSGKYQKVRTNSRKYRLYFK